MSVIHRPRKRLVPIKHPQFPDQLKYKSKIHLAAFFCPKGLEE